MDNLQNFGTVNLNIGVGMAKPIKKEETKRQKFIRLKEARITRLAKILELLANLTNKQNYDFTDRDVEEMRSEVWALFKKYEKKLLGETFKL